MEENRIFEQVGAKTLRPPFHMTSLKRDAIVYVSEVVVVELEVNRRGRDRAVAKK